MSVERSEEKVVDEGRDKYNSTQQPEFQQGMGWIISAMLVLFLSVLFFSSNGIGQLKIILLRFEGDEI